MLATVQLWDKFFLEMEVIYIVQVPLNLKNVSEIGDVDVTRPKRLLYITRIRILLEGGRRTHRASTTLQHQETFESI